MNAHTQCPRVFCIGRNYAKHIDELGDPDAERCVVFMKPPSCLVPPGEPITLPRDAGEVHHEAELVVEIGREGRDIDERNAAEHVGAIGLGLDLTLRELQNRLKASGNPWERCKAFEQSAPLGELTPYDGRDLCDIRFTCHVSGALRQTGHTRDMLFPVPRLIAILSRTWHLRSGDLIYTGTPEGVGPVEPGDTVTIASETLGEYRWPMR